jgi:uncharacterized coiled-coil protein SlyX
VEQHEMSVEDRVIQLESVVATLARLMEKADARAARDAARTDSLERHFKMLTELAVRASERADFADAGLAELRAAQANADARIAALADAQIRTEDALRKLIERDRGGANGSGQ